MAAKKPPRTEPEPIVARAQALKPALRAALLPWFAKEQRPLPWRRTTDPYAIWISEVMLQQTQVERVKDYWPRFLARFPTVAALADAELPDVLGLWRGLGYYGRARNLHKAARLLVEAHGGALPRAPEALRGLPGFGRYTTGAVASIAFGQRSPLVDGNVARVFSRLFEVEGAPGSPAREAALWAAAEVLVDGPTPGDWNQALMELGATVCTPSSPLCLLCPVRASCGALASGRVQDLPPARKPPKRKVLELAVAVAVAKGRVLLGRRSDEDGLFGGLWELPSFPIEAGQTGDDVLERALGRKAAVGPELTVIERTLTHRDLKLRLHAVRMPAGLPRRTDTHVEWRWVTRSEAAGLGMSSAMQRALDAAVPERSA